MANSSVKGEARRYGTKSLIYQHSRCKYLIRTFFPGFSLLSRTRSPEPLLKPRVSDFRRTWNALIILNVSGSCLELLNQCLRFPLSCLLLIWSPSPSFHHWPEVYSYLITFSVEFYAINVLIGPLLALPS